MTSLGPTDVMTSVGPPDVMTSVESTDVFVIQINRSTNDTFSHDKKILTRLLKCAWKQITVNENLISNPDINTLE